MPPLNHSYFYRKYFHTNIDYREENRLNKNRQKREEQENYFNLLKFNHLSYCYCNYKNQLEKDNNVMMGRLPNLLEKYDIPKSDDTIYVEYYFNS